ncbi:MAG: hypothetical protein GEV08_04260 [Acidimicrobiia bacterium]|nr:hypothetical protein [Acidimicrobiia bacterium]
MVGVLIRMKVALLRGATTGDRAAWMVTGATVGVGLALGTIVLSLLRPADPQLVPDLLLQLTLVVLLSQAASAMFAKVARPRTGAALNGVLLALVMVLSQSGWMVVIGLIASGVLTDGLPAGVTTATRVAPPGWGLAAVEAVAGGDWWVGAAAMGGHGGAGGVLIAVLGRSLGEPRGARAVIRGPSVARQAGRFGSGPAGAVLGKELRTWRRGRARTSAIAAPVAWGMATASLPLTFGETALLPWAAPLIAVVAATYMANLYGGDGTGVWLTIQTGSERADLFARQWAYLAVFTPITVLIADRLAATHHSQKGAHVTSSTRTLTPSRQPSGLEPALRCRFVGRRDPDRHEQAQQMTPDTLVRDFNEFRPRLLG